VQATDAIQDIDAGRWVARTHADRNVDTLLFRRFSELTNVVREAHRE